MCINVHRGVWRMQICIWVPTQMHICMRVFLRAYLFEAYVQVRRLCMCGREMCVMVRSPSLHKAKFGLAPS